MKKLIFVLTFALFFLSACGQKKVQTDAQTQTADDGDYYRNNFLYINCLVKNNNVDSMVIKIYIPNEDGERIEKEANFYLFNRGDTLIYNKNLMNNNSTLLKSNDNRHVSEIRWIDKDGTEDIKYETAVAPNVRVRKGMKGNVTSDSVVITYYKDHLDERYFMGEKKIEYMTSKVEFDKNNNFVQSTNKFYDDLTIEKYEYDKDGFVVKWEREFSSPEYSLQKAEMNMKYKLNDRGDWVEMKSYSDGKVSGITEREIYYKD